MFAKHFKDTPKSIFSSPLKTVLVVDGKVVKFTYIEIDKPKMVKKAPMHCMHGYYKHTFLLGRENLNQKIFSKLDNTHSFFMYVERPFSKLTLAFREGPRVYSLLTTFQLSDVQGSDTTHTFCSINGYIVRWWY